MKVYKDTEHSVTLHPFTWQKKRYLMTCVGLYVGFDPNGGASSLRSEQSFWDEAPQCFADLGQAPNLDNCFPKPSGEVLVAGFCRTPRKALVPAMEASFRVGALERKFAIFGDRERHHTGDCTDPIPFQSQPLIWEKAFGGENFAANHLGKGLDAENKSNTLVPNIEDPKKLMLQKDDNIFPSCPFPIGLDNPMRRKLSGTYNQHWVDHIAPEFPEDFDAEFFYSAQKEQRLPFINGKGTFFKGNESIEIKGMHHDYPIIHSKLPEKNIRVFITTAEHFTPFDGTREHHLGKKIVPKTPKDSVLLPYAKDLDAKALFRECTMHCDTVWLLPDLMGAFVIYRGLLPVVDDEMDDILRVLVATENQNTTPLSLEHYSDELKRRAHLPTDIDVTPSPEMQAAATKVVKLLRGVPKAFERVKKDFLNENPIMPFSIDDIAFSGQKTLNESKKTLATLENTVSTLKKELGHAVNLNAFNFTAMHQNIAGQEKNLAEMVSHAQKTVAKTDDFVLNCINEQKKSAQEFSVNLPGDSNFKKDLPQTLELIDSAKKMQMKELLESPISINPWHDAGFSLVIQARRQLIRDDIALQYLKSIGLDHATIQNAWLGVLDKPYTLIAEDWGLEQSPALPNQVLPKGLVLPRFEGKTLVSLTVYPLNQNSDPDFSLIFNEEAVVIAQGSEDKQLSLPPSYPDGAIIACPDDLTSVFAEQEVGDFCHVYTAKEPDQVQDTEGVPLVVLLPNLDLNPEGKNIFSAWQEKHPTAVAVYLPKKCSHVFELMENEKTLRPLVLEVLPPAMAKENEFGFILPKEGDDFKGFKMNFPFLTEADLKGRITKLEADIRSKFPDPAKELEHARNNFKTVFLDNMKENGASKSQIDKAKECLDKAPAPQKIAPSKEPPVESAFKYIKEQNAELRDVINKSGMSEQNKIITLKELDAADKKTLELENELLPLDKIHADGMKKIKDLKEGKIPEEIQKAYDKAGFDPNVIKPLTRDDVENILATTKDFTQKNLSKLDASGLNFSNANFNMTMCNETNFEGCCFDNANFLLILGSKANFKRTTFHGATIKLGTFDQSCFVESDFRTAYMELPLFDGVDATNAKFDQANIKLTNFASSILTDATFNNTLLSLCNFTESIVAGANFEKVRAFKCLFSKCDFAHATFEEATLDQCLFQESKAMKVNFKNADLKKVNTEAYSDFSEADFKGADLRSANLRLSFFNGADFYGARLDNALFSNCDMTAVKIDGTQAAGCRIRKCDLTQADLSYSNFNSGDLFKSRLNSANLTGSNLFSANIHKIRIDPATKLSGVNLKKTILAGKEDVLGYITRQNS